jgi:hypothetical protein
MFDTNYMQRLFETGRALGAAGYQWEKLPPAIRRRDKSPEQGLPAVGRRAGGATSSAGSSSAQPAAG